MKEPGIEAEPSVEREWFFMPPLFATDTARGTLRQWSERTRFTRHAAVRLPRTGS
jgi:hypothetical protein